jgi:hypothetical protein
MKSKKLPTEWIERIFMRLHGRFGNQFTDKWRIGVLNKQGVDIGVLNAKQVWAEELAHLSVERIKKGLSTKFTHPPSCDDFARACAPVPEMHLDGKALPSPKTSREKVESHITKMHEVLHNVKIPKKSELH